MLKQVTYHYVVMKKLVVPEECPTNTYESMMKWIEEQGEQEEEFLINESTMDYEIVDVEKH